MGQNICGDKTSVGQNVRLVIFLRSMLEYLHLGTHRHATEKITFLILCPSGLLFPSGRFVPTDAWSPGCFVPPDVLSPRTFYPSGHLVPEYYISGCYVAGRFASGRFVAPDVISHRTSYLGTLI